jgi:hypothetical protein
MNICEDPLYVKGCVWDGGNYLFKTNIPETFKNYAESFDGIRFIYLTLTLMVA